jgi:ABC-type Na+ efflux pump permease subunit
MDNLILSSRHGRQKIVTAKIAAIVVTAACLIIAYLMATFTFGFLSVGTFEGGEAAIRYPAMYALPLVLPTGNLL